MVGVGAQQGVGGEHRVGRAGAGGGGGGRGGGWARGAAGGGVGRPALPAVRARAGGRVAGRASGASGVVAASKAPMSHAPACGRWTPRWSVPPQEVPPVFSAALPGRIARVSVGPPLSASGPSPMFDEVWLVSAVNSSQLVSSAR